MKSLNNNKSKSSWSGIMRNDIDDDRVTFRKFMQVLAVLILFSIMLEAAMLYLGIQILEWLTN